MTNREFSKTEEFIKCCKKAGIEPTKRQASKFKNKKGTAYNFKDK